MNLYITEEGELMRQEKELLPAYVFEYLKIYQNTIIDRKLLINCGVEAIIEECKTKGYDVRLVINTPLEISTLHTHKKRKQVQYPPENTYILEVIEKELLYAKK